MGQPDDTFIGAVMDIETGGLLTSKPVALFCYPDGSKVELLLPHVTEADMKAVSEMLNKARLNARDQPGRRSRKRRQTAAAARPCGRA